MSAQQAIAQTRIPLADGGEADVLECRRYLVISSREAGYFKRKYNRRIRQQAKASLQRLKGSGLLFSAARSCYS